MTVPPLPGSPGAITDVPGVLVGQHQRMGRGWRTGTTVVHVPGGATPGVDVRGGGPGTRETDALAVTNLVTTVHAVCLTGGSAYGLAAADGVVAWLEERGLGVPVGPGPNEVVPVVPTAVVFDLGRGGRFANRPDASFGRRAIERARRHTDRGAVGAGTGAVAGRLQGGVGTASVHVPVADDTRAGGGSHLVVGALAVVNASGFVIDPATALPWHPPASLRRPPAAERHALAEHLARTEPSPALNTTIGVIATNAALTKAECTRLATVGHDGMARAVRPVHSMFDGDTVFSLATGEIDLPEPDQHFRAPVGRLALLNRILDAAARAFELACIDAVCSARSVGGPPAHRDLCPGAYSSSDVDR